MEELLRFLNKYELWIYSIIGGLFLIYLRQLIVSWQNWKNSIFGLEKESAQKKFSASLAVTGLLGLILLSELIIISFVVPALPQSIFLPTPTLDILITPTATYNILGGDSNVLSTSDSTPISEGSSGCISGQIEWTYPLDGEQISGVVELMGTVNLSTLGFYKFEYSAAGSNSWVTIAAGSEMKTEEALGGKWNTEQLVPGDYILRLVVTDNLNTELTPCDITVSVVSVE